MPKKIFKQNGSMLILTLVATGLFLSILFGAIGVSILQRKLNLSKVARIQALHIAEAGVNYYRWVLYHNHTDYCNSKTCLGPPDYGPYGPYAYKDSAGKNITGYYELYITPPPANGSTVVKIKSVGWVADHPGVKRSISVRCGIPSWSAYSTLANADIRFGEGTEVWGPIHSNGGIRFDGLTHNLVTSALLDYNDPDHSGPNEFAVHTHVPPIDPLPDGNNPPQNVPDRPDVFMAGRQFPVSTISFDLLDNYVNDTYALATTSGFVIDPRPAGTADPSSEPIFWGCAAAGSSCDEGLHITLKTNGTFDVKGVSRVYRDCSGNASNSIKTEENSAHNFPIPVNGIIFVKHRVWVDGKINNSRVTILAFNEPFSSGTADIIVNNDLTYSLYDSTDAIGLIAQRDISVGQYSEDNLRIDAALIAKGGRIGRNYYGSSCDDFKRDTITVYGSLATKNRYGFSWGCWWGWCSGYHYRNLIYDNNLTFAPPPHYPTTGEYTFISWKEE